MHVKRLLLSLTLFLSAIICNGQIGYSYTDPCTGVIKTIQVPSTGITVTYYGQVNTFDPDDFYSGVFEAWSQDVFGSFGNNNPCASVVGLPTTVTVAQGSAISFLGIVNSLSSLADLASSSTSITSSIGSVQNIDVSSGNSTSTTSNDNSSISSTSSDNNSGNTGNPSGGNNGDGGGSGGNNGDGGGSGGSGGDGGGSGGNNGDGGKTEETPPDSPAEAESGGSTNVVGTGVGSVQNSSSDGGGDSKGGSGGSKSNGNPTAKNGNRPSILASSDFVGFNFKNSEVKRGGKVAGGYTAMRWDGKRSSGVNVDYTTAMKGPNITGFYAIMGPKRIDLISTSVTLGFDVKKTAYGTLAFGQMWSIKKNIKVIYMLTGSYGSVAETPFIGTAAITGGMWDLKVRKSIDVKLLCLYVYAPYVSYYNDILLKSPHVVLPIVGTNVGITKRFKLNINIGGAWAIQDAALNYTVMMGTRMLL